MSKPKVVPQSPAVAPAVAPAVVAPAKPFTANMKLERLAVREIVKAALNLPKEAITSREAGHIDLVVSPSMFATVEALKAALLSACASNGIQCTITTESAGPKVIGVTFTNDLMQRQVLWGARQHSRQSRVLAEAALTQAPAPVAPVAPVAPEGKPEGKAGKGKKIKA